VSDQKHRVPIEQLVSAIEELLWTGPSIIDDIAHVLCYSAAAIHVRLHQLMQEGRAHRQRIRCVNNPAVFYRWHAGPGAGRIDGAPNLDMDESDLRPVQVTVHTYPVVNRRDPLVAAFFGQPA
jgi:hypothetical protein